MKAIFYKEWIKTRWYLIVAMLVMTGFTGYAMLRINRTINLKGIEHVWEVMLSRDAVFVDILEFIPLLAGLLLAVVQFAPEMHRKCLKLTLHLPVAHLRTTNQMLCYGLMALTACFAISLAIMFGYMQTVFAFELYTRVLLTAAPWFVAGIAAYLLAAWTCLEPTWKRRIINLAITVLLLRIFFLAPAPEAYNSFLPLLAIYSLMLVSLSWLSISRFKEGKQD